MKNKLFIGLLFISLCAGLSYAADYDGNKNISELDNIGTDVTKDVYVLVQDPADPSKIGRATLSQLTDRGLITRGVYPDGSIYLNGDPASPMPGDLRFKELDGISSFEIYDLDTASWIPAPAQVGRGSLSAGPQISIGEAGSMIVFRLKKDVGKFYFPPVTGLDNTGRTLPIAVFEPEDGGAVATVGIRTGNTTNMPATDVAGTFTLGYTTVLTDNFLVWAHTLYCGTTNPTENITYRVYEHTDATDRAKLLVEKVFPASLFSSASPSDPIKLEIKSDGSFQPILGTLGGNYFVEFTSDAAFSFYGNGTLPDISLDLQTVTLRYIQYANSSIITADRTVNTGDYFFVDTSAGAVTLTAMADAISFNIEDFGESFGNPNDCTLVLGTHFAVLNKKKGRYRFFKDGTDWWYQDLRSGKTAEVASTHYADADFKITPLYDAFREASTYNTGDCVVNTDDDKIYYALQNSITGPWVSGEWSELGPEGQSFWTQTGSDLGYTTGKVGVGIGVPLDHLTVIDSDDTLNGGGLRIQDASGDYATFAMASNNSYLFSSVGDLVIYPANSESMRFESGGDIKINTGTLFLPQGGSMGTDTVDTADDSYIALVGGDPTRGREAGGSMALFGNEYSSLPGAVRVEGGNVTGSSIQLRTENANRIVIDSTETVVSGKAGYNATTDMGTEDTDFASKKYVDDNSGGSSGSALPSLTLGNDDTNVDDFDVSSIAPAGVLFVNNTTEILYLRGFSNGVAGQIIYITKIATNDLTIVDNATAGTQKINGSGGNDKTIQTTGGAILVCDGTAWYVISQTG